MNIIPPVAGQAPSADTIATVTLTPTAGTGVYLHGIRYSASGTPTGMTLTVQWTVGLTTYTETYYPAVAGMDYLPYEGNSQFPKGIAVTFALSAVSGVSGTIYPNAEFR